MNVENAFSAGRDLSGIDLDLQKLSNQLADTHGFPYISGALFAFF